jgi:recombination protein RecR
MSYSKVIQDLIDEFNKLPGIGPKTSERFVFYLLENSPENLDSLAEAIQALKKVSQCSVCFNFSEQKICPICADRRRYHSIICVVAKPQDLMAIEKTKEFKGVYHVLGGIIDRPRGIGPKELKIKELVSRIKKEPKIKEIILAFNPDLEGETTILYLTKILQPIRQAPFGPSSGRGQGKLEIKITRLAKGLPMGGELEYADELTLSDALKGRKEIG